MRELCVCVCVKDKKGNSQGRNQQEAKVNLGMMPTKESFCHIFAESPTCPSALWILRERILRKCGCVWSKMTTYLGRLIHQGKTK